jgi:hypothetical protein
MQLHLKTAPSSKLYAKAYKNEFKEFILILYICLTYTLNSLKIYFLVIHENGQNTLSFSMQLKENVMS